MKDQAASHEAEQFGAGLDDSLSRAWWVLVYENRYVIWGRLESGRLKDYEVYEDTQKARALDDWLAAHERPALAS